MPWLTAVAMFAFYGYHLPLVFAIVVSARGLGLGVSAFEPRFAKRSAEKHLVGRKWYGTQRKRLEKVQLPPKKALRFGLGLLKSARLVRLDVRLTIGTGDAAMTAQACGVVTVLSHTILAATGAPGAICVVPDFGKAALSGEACGIVRLTVGHIMRAAARTILRGAGG